MPYLICYDITSNRKRAKIAKRLKASGMVRIQKSVFVGYLSPNGLTALENKLHTLVRKKLKPNDKLCIINIHRNAFLKMTQLGTQLDPKLALGREKVIFL